MYWWECVKKKTFKQKSEKMLTKALKSLPAGGCIWLLKKQMWNKIARPYWDYPLGDCLSGVAGAAEMVTPIFREFAELPTPATETEF